jgi:hypothetical protein
MSRAAALASSVSALLGHQLAVRSCLICSLLLLLSSFNDIFNLLPS